MFPTRTSPMPAAASPPRDCGRVVAFAAALLVLPLSARADAERSPGSCAAAEDDVPTAGPSCAEAGREGLSAVAFPWTAPHFALERPLSRAFRYAAHPHAGGEPGLLRFGEPVAPLDNPRDAFVARCQTDAAGETGCRPRGPLSRHRGELSLGAGVLVDGSVSAHAAARLRTRVRLSPGVEVLAYLRPQDGGARRWLGHYALDYRFAQAPHLQLRSGLGALSWTRAGGTRAGGYLDYALEWFPRAPWTVTALTAIGGVDGALYGRVSLTASAVWRRLEVQLAYDHISLRGVAVTRLSGPRLGLRIWL